MHTQLNFSCDSNAVITYGLHIIQIIRRSVKQKVVAHQLQKMHSRWVPYLQFIPLMVRLFMVHLCSPLHFIKKKEKEFRIAHTSTNIYVVYSKTNAKKLWEKKKQKHNTVNTCRKHHFDEKIFIRQNFHCTLFWRKGVNTTYTQRVGLSTRELFKKYFDGIFCSSRHKYFAALRIVAESPTTSNSRRWGRDGADGRWRRERL